MLKHKLKMGLKKKVADWGYGSGVWRVANRLGQSGRITLLTLHCVGFPEGTNYLPSYMKLSEESFDTLMGGLARSFEVLDLHEAIRRLDAGEKGRNAIVITLDDGYKDNYTHALPILQKHGIPATIFLEAGAVDRRSLSWIHKYFFVHAEKGSTFYALEFAERCEGADLSKRLREAAKTPEGAEYAVKKLLKYEADRVERDRVTDEIFQSVGGDERQILDGAYLTWDEVREMAAQGIRFGGHTMTHPILSSLTKDEARLEIVESKKVIEDKGGVQVDTFAYPWGRAWDFNAETQAVLKEEGFICGLAMNETSALPGKCDLFNMSRYPLAEGFSTSDIFAQAAGLYGWFGGRL